MSRQYDGKKRQRRFGIGKYKDTAISKRRQLTYSELSNKIKSTDNLKVIRALILSYIKDGGLYPKMYGRDGDRNMVGDC